MPLDVSSGFVASFSCSIGAFPRGFFPFLLRPCAALYNLCCIVTMEQKSLIFACWVGRSFFGFATPMIEPKNKSKIEKKETCLWGTTVIFWCRHFLAQDNAGGKNDHGRANGVHNNTWVRG